MLKREIFGPIIPILSVSGIEEANQESSLVDADLQASQRAGD